MVRPELDPQVLDHDLLRFADEPCAGPGPLGSFQRQPGEVLEGLRVERPLHAVPRPADLAHRVHLAIFVTALHDGGGTPHRTGFELAPVALGDGLQFAVGRSDRPKFRKPDAAVEPRRDGWGCAHPIGGGEQEIALAGQLACSRLTISRRPSRGQRASGTPTRT